MIVTSVGKNIDAYCLKCKLVLAHVVMFKVDGVVSRVKCKTCGAEHKYRGTLPAAKKPAAARAPGMTGAKKPSATVAVKDSPMRWALKSRNMPPGTPMRNYSIRETFKVNDAINHPVFGVGFVEKVVTDKSIYVLFNDSIRLMSMNVTS
jgi:hypothetical protein